MRIAIKGGRLIDPANKTDSKLNLSIANGKIDEITAGDVYGDVNIFADGLVVAPGFIDIHMHEDNREEIDRPVIDYDILRYMARMGVTSCFGGNCGQGTRYPREYLNILDENGCPTNFGLFVPHGSIRERVGCMNPYQTPNPDQMKKMVKITEECLEAGCFGISYGLRWYPGCTWEENIAMAKLAARYQTIISSHVRDDADKVIESIQEMLEIARKANVHVEISHLGSMAAYGMMENVLAYLDEKRCKGDKIGLECYPYNEFCTEIDCATFSEGFLDKYKIDYPSIVFAEGKYKGQQATRQTFEEIKATHPDTLVIAYVMKQNEVEMCINHPNTVVMSDGILHKGQGHPRATGTFPRFLRYFVREQKFLTLNEALAKITAQPAAILGMTRKGNLAVGSDADIVIFSPEKIAEQATIDKMSLPPIGINYVIINGEIAAKDGELLQEKCGRALRKNRC